MMDVGGFFFEFEAVRTDLTEMLGAISIYVSESAVDVPTFSKHDIIMLKVLSRTQLLHQAKVWVIGRSRELARNI